MQVKFVLSEKTKVYFKASGGYVLINESGSVDLTEGELEELAKIEGLRKQSLQDMVKIWSRLGGGRHGS